MEAVRRLFKPERTTFWPMHLDLLAGTTAASIQDFKNL